MTTEQELYQKLINRIQEYHPSKDYSMIEKAYKLASEAHQSQVRKSGEPYIIHPLEVSYILAELELDMESMVAGILHDVIEDTDYTYEDLEKMFNTEVANLVDGVTKLGKLSYSTKEEMQAENYRKMFLAMAKDIRVILIKLADRLHNMRTLNYMTTAKQIEKAQETQEIYAPLAHRLGIAKISIEMEDLSFKYLNEEAFADLATKIKTRQSERENFVNGIVKQVNEKLLEADVEGKIEGRNKHFFSIYKKMVKQNKCLDEIYDLFAIRIIVDSVKDCYAVLGIIHTMYTPMPGRFKDYIAMPKQNMYQSLHNTLIGTNGQPFEIQIRTWDMHRTSEYGIAAHWKYKEGRSGTISSDNEEEKLAWLGQILEWQKDMSDNKEYLDTIKLDLNVFTTQVYSFTPQGRVIQLPKHSTPIDFAYMIHSAIGNKMVGARVNGKMVSIEYSIKNGDIVEIMNSQNSKGPSRDWLNIVKSSQAKNKIRQWFKKEEKEENIIRGKDLLHADIKKKGFAPHDLLKPEWIELVIQKYDFKNWDSLLAALGYGGLREGQVSSRLVEEYNKEKRETQTTEDVIKDFEERIEKRNQNRPKQKPRNKSGITVEGIGDVPVRFSKCCSPVPGDEVIGFVTRGRGVTVHRTDCLNVLNLTEDDRRRLIHVEWNQEQDNETTFSAEILVSVYDRTGVLSEVTYLLSSEDIPVKNLTIKMNKDIAFFNITIEIHSKEQLERTCKKLKSISSVLDVERVRG